MGKKTLILLALFAIAILSGLYYYNNPTQEVDQTKSDFMSNWTKAWEFKFEEQSKKAEAERLLKEAEQARIEKEKALWIYQTWDNWKLIQ